MSENVHTIKMSNGVFLSNLGVVLRKTTTPKKRFPGPTKNPHTQQEVKHKTMAEF